MTSTPAAHRPPVLDFPRPEPRLPSALLHADDRVMSWLDRLYSGRTEQRGLEAPFEHASAHLNPHDVLLAFIEAARAGRERHFEAVESGAPTHPLAG